MDNVLKIVGKAVAYAVVLIVAVALVFRGLVGTLWGSHSDIGVLAAPFAGILGFLGILWLAGRLFKDLQNDLNSEKE